MKTKILLIIAIAGFFRSNAMDHMELSTSCSQPASQETQIEPIDSNKLYIALEQLNSATKREKPNLLSRFISCYKQFNKSDAKKADESLLEILSLDLSLSSSCFIHSHIYNHIHILRHMSGTIVQAYMDDTLKSHHLSFVENLLKVSEDTLDNTPLSRGNIFNALLSCASMDSDQISALRYFIENTNDEFLRKNLTSIVQALPNLVNNCHPVLLTLLNRTQIKELKDAIIDNFLKVDSSLSPIKIVWRIEDLLQANLSLPLIERLNNEFVKTKFALGIQVLWKYLLLTEPKLCYDFILNFYNVPVSVDLYTLSPNDFISKIFQLMVEKNIMSTSQVVQQYNIAKLSEFAPILQSSYVKEVICSEFVADCIVVANRTPEKIDSDIIANIDGLFLERKSAVVESIKNKSPDGSIIKSYIESFLNLIYSSKITRPDILRNMKKLREVRKAAGIQETLPRQIIDRFGLIPNFLYKNDGNFIELSSGISKILKKDGKIFCWTTPYSREPSKLSLLDDNWETIWEYRLSDERYPICTQFVASKIFLADGCKLMTVDAKKMGESIIHHDFSSSYDKPINFFVITGDNIYVIQKDKLSSGSIDRSGSNEKIKLVQSVEINSYWDYLSVGNKLLLFDNDNIELYDSSLNKYNIITCLEDDYIGLHHSCVSAEKNIFCFTRRLANKTKELVCWDANLNSELFKCSLGKVESVRTKISEDLTKIIVLTEDGKVLIVNALPNMEEDKRIMANISLPIELHTIFSWSTTLCFSDTGNLVFIKSTSGNILYILNLRNMQVSTIIIEDRTLLGSINDMPIVS